jgi:ACS family D-galactonate transporter-like MFS transporter
MSGFSRKSVRWKIGFLMFAGVAINYLDRVNISHAIVSISGQLHLTSFQQGVILSCFSFGYVVFMIPAGILLDKYGGRVILSISVFLLSIATILTGLSTHFITLILFRILIGIFEAPLFPGNAKVVADWFQPGERSRATALFDAGSYVGSAFAAPFIIYTIIHAGWQYSFYLSGTIGMLWALIWYSYFRNNPSQHKKIHLSEVNLINKQPELNIPNKRRYPWYSLLARKKVLGMCYGFFCYNYLKSFFLTWLPTYLIAEKGLTFSKVGLIALIPPFCAIVGELVTGMITDKLIQKGVSVTFARKLPLCIGMIMSSIIVLGTLLNSVLGLVIILSISYTFLISSSVGIWSIPSDIAPSPSYVGVIGGIQNAFSNVAGIIAPIATGYLFGITQSFYLPLLVSSIFAITGAAAYWFIVGELKPLKL